MGTLLWWHCSAVFNKTKYANSLFFTSYTWHTIFYDQQMAAAITARGNSRSSSLTTHCSFRGSTHVQGWRYAHSKFCDNVKLTVYVISMWRTGRNNWWGAHNNSSVITRCTSQSNNNAKTTFQGVAQRRLFSGGVSQSRPSKSCSSWKLTKLTNKNLRKFVSGGGWPFRPHPGCATASRLIHVKTRQWTIFVPLKLLQNENLPIMRI